MYAPAPVQPRVRLHARSHPRPQPRPTRLVVLDAPTRLARLPARGAPAIACATADHRLASRTAFGGRARGPRHTSGVPLTRRKRISRTDHCAPTLRHQQAWPAGHRPSRPRQAALPPTSTHGCTSRCTAPRGWPAEPVDDQQRWRLRAAPRLAATRLAVTCSSCSRTPRFTGPALGWWTKDEHTCAPAPVQPLVGRRSQPEPPRHRGMLFRLPGPRASAADQRRAARPTPPSRRRPRSLPLPGR